MAWRSCQYGIIFFILIPSVVINITQCTGFQWHNVKKNVYVTQGQDTGLHWIFQTTASKSAKVRLAFEKQGTAYETDLVNGDIILDSSVAHFRNEPNAKHNITCDYTNGPLRSIDCSIKATSIDQAGSYGLHLEIEPKIKKHVAIRVFVNYDYKWIDEPRNIRVYPQETATWRVSFQKPVNIIPVFPLKISISYSNLTTNENVLQLVSSEIFSNRSGLVDLTLATDMPSIQNRICFNYEEGTLTMFFWNITKADSGSFQIVSKMGLSDGPFEQSIMTHTVVLVVLDDSPPDSNHFACNITCNMSVCEDFELVNCNSTICKDCKQIRDHAESESLNCTRWRRTMIALGILFPLTVFAVVALVLTVYRKCTDQKPESSTSNPNLHELQGLNQQNEGQ